VQLHLSFFRLSPGREAQKGQCPEDRYHAEETVAIQGIRERSFHSEPAVILTKLPAPAKMFSSIMEQIVISDTLLDIAAGRLAGSCPRVAAESRLDLEANERTIWGPFNGFGVEVRGRLPAALRRVGEHGADRGMAETGAPARP
jgi:hypothetical protein